MSLGPWEIALIFLVVLLVFGAKRIPEIARGMGKGIREFKDATSDIKQELTVSEPSRQIPPTRVEPAQPVATQQQPVPTAPAPAPPQPPSAPPTDGSTPA